MSPFAATMTSHGWLSWPGPLPAVPASPSRISFLAVRTELDNLVAFGTGLVSGKVGHPDVAIAVDVEAVRCHKQSRRQSSSAPPLCCGRT